MIIQKTSKQEVIHQVIAYFLAVFLITTILNSIGESWGIASIPVYIAKLLVGWCVVYSCYIFSLFIVNFLLRLTINNGCEK